MGDEGLAEMIGMMVLNMINNGARTPIVLDDRSGAWYAMELDKYLAARKEALRDTREEWEITRDMTLG